MTTNCFAGPSLVLFALARPSRYASKFLHHSDNANSAAWLRAAPPKQSTCLDFVPSNALCVRGHSAEMPAASGAPYLCLPDVRWAHCVRGIWPAGCLHGPFSTAAEKLSLSTSQPKWPAAIMASRIDASAAYHAQQWACRFAHQDVQADISALLAAPLPGAAPGSESMAGEAGQAGTAAATSAGTAHASTDSAGASGSQAGALLCTPDFVVHCAGLQALAAISCAQSAAKPTTQFVA